MKKNEMKKGRDYIGVGCGAMVFNDEGKVFVAKRGPKSRNEAGKWDFPGGGVDFNERCEDAVVREFLEEHNIEIEIVELLEVINHILPDEQQHWVSPSYIARHVSGEAIIVEPEKCEEICWVFLDEIDPETLSLPSRSNFDKYIEKYGHSAPKKADER